MCGRRVPEHDSAEGRVLRLRVRDVVRERADVDVALARGVRRTGRADVHLHVLVRGLRLRPRVPRREVVVRGLVEPAVVVVCVAYQKSATFGSDTRHRGAHVQNWT